MSCRLDVRLCQQDGTGGGDGIGGGVHDLLRTDLLEFNRKGLALSLPRSQQINNGLFGCLVTHGSGAVTDMTGGTVGATKAAESTVRERILKWLESKVD